MVPMRTQKRQEAPHEPGATSNTERRNEQGFALPFDVRRWMFDVFPGLRGFNARIVHFEEISLRSCLAGRGSGTSAMVVGIQMCPAFWGMACQNAMPRLRDDLCNFHWS